MSAQKYCLSCYCNLRENGECPQCPLEGLREAVIDAAKAWNAVWESDATTPEHYEGIYVVADRLSTAVDALNKAGAE